ncbi:MAG: flavin reductase family protein [Rhodobacteraceae bacterium]|nr:flavin reductase family protein [Paracoccaceae bacterium]MCB1368244.1 flavin reductase family protein [Paracoccaceae bacterium]
MFYRPEDGHGLPHSPFNAIVTPRPIGWISTRGSDGSDNLAPYSFFNGVAYVPPQVMFATVAFKDSIRKVQESGVFCVNIVSEALTAQMNITAENFPASVDEFVKAGLEKAECTTIDCARVAAAPASLECRMTAIHRLEGADNHIIVGTVTGVHIRDDCLVNGRFDVTTFNPLARLGYRDYTVVREVFELARPDD